MNLEVKSSVCTFVDRDLNSVPDQEEKLLKTYVPFTVSMVDCSAETIRAALLAPLPSFVKSFNDNDSKFKIVLPMATLVDLSDPASFE